MEKRKKSFAFQDVVLVADPFDENKNNNSPMHIRRDLEMTGVRTLDSLRDTIEELGLKFHHYTSPEELANNAHKHSKDIILTIYGGECSRNRMALVPAICETFSLKFIGPDVYGRIIAQDKEISKRLAIENGIATAAWRLVRNLNAIKYIQGLTPPLVVKPLMEGSSIGISQGNKVATMDEAKKLAQKILCTFRQPVLIEEFVPGREVAYCRIENAGEKAWAYSEIIIKSNPNFFMTRLFDAEEKRNPTLGRSVQNIDSELNSKDKKALEAFLAAFGKYGYCRIDGRLVDESFYFLEFTPDAWIAPTGQFAKGFTEKGWNYSDVIAAVLSSTD